MKIMITDHAIKTIKKRFGIKQKAIYDLVEKAFIHGIQHKDIKGSLNRYITKLFFKNKTANNIRIFRGFIFIFANNKLITGYPVPAQYKKYIDSLVNNMKVIEG